MTKEDIEAVVSNHIDQYTLRPCVDLNQTFHNMGMDSLDIACLVFDIEAGLGLEPIGDVLVGDFVTPRDLVNVIVKYGKEDK